MNFISKFRAQLTRKLPYIVILLFALQPLMDILSYWVGELELSSIPTLMLRFVVLAVTVLLGFGLSRRKRAYWITAGVLFLICLGHIFACSQYGYRNIVSDLTNYTRVAQIPLFVLCLVTFLQENEACYRAMKQGLAACLLIILATEVLAALTHTEPHTYMDGKGYIGWFSNTNSQSAILTMLSPVVMAWLYGKKGFKSPLFWLATLGSFTAMYLLGTRLAYLGLAAAGFGLGISVILIRPADWKQACVFFTVTIVFLALMPFSPMVRHQSIYDSVQTDRQDSINEILTAETPEVLDEADISQEELERRQEQWVEVLTPIYELYAADFVQLFGAKRTIEIYDYSSDIRVITATRPKKLQFARLLMEDSPISARFFGIELDRFTINGNIYDVENDIHGIYFLYGYVGLAAILTFLAYFLYLIAAALLRDAKTYFTMDAAGWGIALIMCLCHIYCTAGVLRRPNASIYLSAALAAVYYLIKIKQYPPKETKLSEAR